MSSYRCVFLMGVEQALEYRVSFFLSMLSAVFPIIIQARHKRRVFQLLP